MGGVDPAAVQALVSTAGLGPVRAVIPLAGGANNRVFRVETPTAVALLKSYFRHPDDTRDRLGAEWSFATFAWENGVRCIPQPLAADPAAGLALFEFVFGRSLRGSVAGEPSVDQAVEFFRTLNRARQEPGAAALPTASESCFSLDDHLATVARRVEQLTTLPVGNAIDSTARSFAEGELAPAWADVLTTARASAKALGSSLDAANRCLSPSDFGFHNALLANDGRLRFIDFEYAGWDDPSKLVCDFFCQPAVPAPPAAFDRFAAAIAAELPEPRLHLARSTLLLPVYRVKWVCIMLNEFLPVGSTRRRFSAVADPESRKAAQLAKARASLAAVRYPGASPRKVA
jgi:hypothetical protein